MFEKERIEARGKLASSGLGTVMRITSDDALVNAGFSLRTAA